MRHVVLVAALLTGTALVGAAGAEDPGALVKPLAGMRIAMLTGEGFQDAEAMMPLAFLTNRGATVTVIGAETGEVRAYSSEATLLIEKTVADVSPADFDALVLPGGMAPATIREHQGAVDFVREICEAGKPVAAICHGPQILISAGVVEDVKMTCYANVAEELKEAGANYEDKPVVRDGNLVTSRQPGDIPAWLDAMEDLFIEARGEKT